jgi:hypothetical protein
MSWPAPAAWPDLDAAAALPDRRAERRRVAEPDLEFREFCRRSKLPQSEPHDHRAADHVQLRCGERQRHIPPPPGLCTRVRAAAGFRHDIESSTDRRRTTRFTT